VGAGVLGVMSAGWAAPAAACECRPRAEHAAEELARHKSAFAGRVKDVKTDGDSSLVTFDVHRVWKGPRGKQLVVKTAASGTACGASFETGKDYLVYADGDKNALSADRCGQSELAESARWVRQLDLHTGRGASPLKVPEATTETARQQ
jgi:hypothetical protein